MSRKRRNSMALGAGHDLSARPTCAATGKRRYRSHRAAVAAHRFAGFRVRTYACSSCGDLHVTNQEKDA